MDSNIVRQPVIYKEEVNDSDYEDSKYHIKAALRSRSHRERQKHSQNWSASTIVCIPKSNFSQIDTTRKRKSSTIVTTEQHKRKKTETQVVKEVGSRINVECRTENPKLQHILPPSISSNEIDTSDSSSDESFQKASDIIKYYLNKRTLQSHSDRSINSQNLSPSVEESTATSAGKEPLTESVSGRNRYSLRTAGKKPTIVETSEISDDDFSIDSNFNYSNKGRKRKVTKNERTRKPQVQKTVSRSSGEDEETPLASSLSDIDMFNDSDSASSFTHLKRGKKRAGRKKLKQVIEPYKIPKAKYDRALEMLNSTKNQFDETPANYTARTSCIVRKKCERRRYEEATHDNDKLGLYRPDSLVRIVCALDTCLENEEWKLIPKLMVFGCGLVDHRVAKEEIVTSFLTHGMLSLLLDQTVDAATLKLFLLKIGKAKCKEADVDEFLKYVNVMLEREAITKSPSSEQEV